MTQKILAAVVMVTLAGLLGCSPEVGSEAWCKKLDAKPKGEWTVNEVGDYTKHCIIRTKK